MAFVLLSCLALNVLATSETFSIPKSAHLIIQSNIVGSIVSAGLDETLDPDQIMVYVIGPSTYEIVRSEKNNVVTFTALDTNLPSAGASLGVSWVLLMASLCHWLLARNASVIILVGVCDLFVCSLLFSFANLT